VLAPPPAGHHPADLLDALPGLGAEVDRVDLARARVQRDRLLRAALHEPQVAARERHNPAVGLEGGRLVERLLGLPEAVLEHQGVREIGQADSVRPNLRAGAEGLLGLGVAAAGEVQFAEHAQSRAVAR
jgi:hypothetical protein